MQATESAQSNKGKDDDQSLDSRSGRGWVPGHRNPAVHQGEHWSSHHVGWICDWSNWFIYGISRMTQFTEEVASMIALLEQENKLIRARNERLEDEVFMLEREISKLKEELDACSNKLRGSV